MQWYYSKNSMQLGPVSQAELLAKVASGEILRSDILLYALFVLVAVLGASA
jgi:GYF domain 2